MIKLGISLKTSLDNSLWFSSYDLLSSSLNKSLFVLLDKSLRNSLREQIMNGIKGIIGE